MANDTVASKNSKFWNELCGSSLAKYLGITDDSPESLKKFDDWYLNFYPYLKEYIQFESLQNKAVLEVGLGYGTVAQKLVESGACYRGLDIAAGPVNMVNHRIGHVGLSGEAVQGSIHEPPFSIGSFDQIVAIGCLHHTGDLKLAIEKCWDLLRPGGQLVFMVYYAYSYRRMRMAPITTLKYFLREWTGFRGVVGQSTSRERTAYDANSSGSGAPHTDWISVRSLRALCHQFDNFRAGIENIDQEPPFSRTPREKLLLTRWPKLIGLDLYAVATK